MIDFSEVYTHSDQPVTCPSCGNRTEIILDLAHTLEETQVHKCLSKHCYNEFVVQKED